MKWEEEGEGVGGRVRLCVKTSPHSLQVFHVPLEERRYQFEEVSFGGETRQSEIVREIQVKTGCDIEMTQVFIQLRHC